MTPRATQSRQAAFFLLPPRFLFLLRSPNERRSYLSSSPSRASNTFPGIRRFPPSPPPIERISFTPRSLSLATPTMPTLLLMRAIVRPVNGGGQRATWFVSSFFSTKSFLIDRKLGTLNAHPRGTTRPNGDRNRSIGASEGLSTSIVRIHNVDTRVAYINSTFYVCLRLSLPLYWARFRLLLLASLPIDEREAPPLLSWMMLGVDPRLPINLR